MDTHKLIHLDFKAENIMVFFNEHLINLHLIDNEFLNKYDFLKKIL